MDSIWAYPIHFRNIIAAFPVDITFSQFSNRCMDEKKQKKIPSFSKKTGSFLIAYIFSGAVTPMRARQLAMTDRTVSASLSRAESTSASSPLIRQAL